MNSSASLALTDGPKNNYNKSSSVSLNLKISSDSTSPQFPLYLKINCNSAADLVPSDNPTGEVKKKKYSSSKSINPILVAQLNDTIKTTSRKLDTNQPSWNDEIYLPLKLQDHSPLLVFSVWDKHTRYKNYLGNLELIFEIFLLKMMGNLFLKLIINGIS